MSRDLSTLFIESRQFGKEFCVVFTSADGTEREVFISYTRGEAEAFVSANIASRSKLWDTLPDATRALP